MLPDCRRLPFPDASFDTVSFVALPQSHSGATPSARRGFAGCCGQSGRLIVTMIGRVIGGIGHAIWWYSEDKHRNVAQGELMGIDPEEVSSLIAEAGFEAVCTRHAAYRLNQIYIAAKSASKL